MGQDERTVIYRYDDLGRVIDATEIGGVSETMQYDANGNVLSAGNGTGGSNTSRTLFTHSGNKLATIRENNRTTYFTYWPNGNLKTNLKENLSFSYNFSNLLTDVRKGGYADRYNHLPCGRNQSQGKGGGRHCSTGESSFTRQL